MRELLLKVFIWEAIAGLVGAIVYATFCPKDTATYWILVATLGGVFFYANEARRLADAEWVPRFGITLSQLPIPGRTERDPNKTHLRVSLGWYSPYPVRGSLEVWEIENEAEVKSMFKDRFIFWAGHEHASRDFATEEWDPPEGTLIRIKINLESPVPTGIRPYQEGVDYRRLHNYLTRTDWQGPFPPDGLGGASRTKE